MFDKDRVSKQSYRERNRDKCMTATRRSQLKSKYGITPEQYDEMFKRQHGKCAICEKESIGERLCVDHDKETGHVRGLLCRQCNLGIGNLDHDIRILRNAALYLVEANWSWIETTEMGL